MTTIAVSQQEGEIVITAGGERTVYAVSKGAVDVPDDEVDAFLTNVGGSTLGSDVPKKDVVKPSDA